MKRDFLIKIIPPQGYTVYRLRFTRRHLLALAALVAAVLLGAIAVHTSELRAASADIAQLHAQRAEQQRRLDAMAQETQALQKQNGESRRAIEAIQRALGTDAARGTRASRAKLHAANIRRENATALQDKLRRLAHATAETHAEAQRLQRLAMRVLNMRHLASIERERLLAAIPSLNPVSGSIASLFGYRTSPYHEFHKGLDLAADYGTTVRASASGTVASAGWDGGFGIKVDVDHGNGYHTWYCHLSRANVAPGERITKGQPIALSGSTGESTGPHLHYQVMRDGQPVDPAPYLNGVPPNVLATLPESGEVP
ncbi:MAG: peptidoglycan DD-metalloendopeptidase family protein [Candidatus Velthaea sp.]